MHDLQRYIPLIIFIGFALWVIVRSNKAQKTATERTKIILDSSQAHFGEAMNVSRQQLEIAKELLAETKALRKSIEEKRNGA